MTRVTAYTAKANLRPEEQLLLCCARTSVDSERAERITTLLERDIDWEYLIQIALPHRVMPLLYRSLQAVCPEAVPKTILEQLQQHFLANAVRNLFLASELLKLLRVFQAQEIPAIPYKGPVLAASVYGNLALREFGDLDILVRERNYPQAQQLLMGHGFRRKENNCEWESTFVDGGGTFEVDLHRRLASREYPSPHFEYLWKRLKPVVMAGRIVATLCPEDTLLMLGIQVALDVDLNDLRLSKIYDIAELLCVHQHLKWPQVLKQAKRLGGQRMLLYGVRLTSELLDTALPQELEPEVSFHSSLIGLVAHARRQLFYRDNSVPEQRPADCLRWLLQERVRDKLWPYYRYLHGIIVPCELDRRLLRLPRELSFLYYFIRPVRLLGKYGLLLLRRLLRHPRDYELST